MINRVLIRIKVLQILFACNQNNDRELSVVENELQLSLKKAYDLYFYLLQLMVDITVWKQQKTDMGKNKFLPTEDELNPNLRLDNNRFVAQLQQNKTLLDYTAHNAISWSNNREVIKHLLAEILESEVYAEYAALPEDNYEADREFWRKAFKNIVCRNEDLELALEDMCIYWNDDMDIVETFIAKTIKRFDEANGAEQELMPMFKNDDDGEFAVQLLRSALLNEEEYNETINQFLKNWDMERVADMDMVLLRAAVAEILNFPSIPTSVTMNEYIEIAKVYSTPKSAVFINGILDALVKKLKADKKLLKN